MARTFEQVPGGVGSVQVVPGVDLTRHRRAGEPVSMYEDVVVRVGELVVEADRVAARRPRDLLSDPVLHHHVRTTDHLHARQSRPAPAAISTYRSSFRSEL